MGIRGKTIGLLAVLIAVPLAVLLGGIYVVGHQLAASIEERETGDALTRAEAVIADSEVQVGSVAGDWATWTDTLEFVNRRQPSYVAQNLAPRYIKSLRLDFMVFYDRAGKIVDTIQVDSAGNAVPLSKDLSAYLAGHPALMRQSDVKHSSVGLVATDRGAAILCARPITNSAGTAPWSGTFVTGRFFDAERVAAVEKLTTTPIALYPMRSAALPADVAAATQRLATGKTVVGALSANRMGGYRLERDLAGNPSIVLRVDTPRTATQFARTSLMQAAIGMAIMAVLMILAVAAVTDKMVLKRLGQLGSEVAAVGQSRDPNARVQIGGTDEIAGVAAGINTMLGQLEESQSDLAYLASHDSLTRLYNRRRFETELRLQLAKQAHGALLWLDVDHFKEVNDGLGHAIGDELLMALADSLAQHTRGAGRVARLGGDEFGILLPNADEDEAIGAAKRILDLTAKNPFSISGHKIRVSVSIGIVLFPAHGATIDDLLARADLAMYQAKSAGRNALSVFTSDEEWQSEMSERIAMAEQIVRALRDDKFLLYAQPVRCTADSTTDTYELLLRMVGEDGKIIMPARIIPTAERVGLIRDIDRWVVRRGIALIDAEQRAGRGTRFAVNVSGTAFSDPELLGVIRDEIARLGIDPSRLIIEITETTAIADIEGAKRFITELRAVGCQFSLDDFGAGTSSFYYLKHLPIDYLKIDGSLVKSLGTNTTDEHFVRAIIEMCRGLEIPTVAEYVEDAELYDIVSKLGVDYAQGYGVGRPEPLSSYFESAPGAGHYVEAEAGTHVGTPVWPPHAAGEPGLTLT